MQMYQKHSTSRFTTLFSVERFFYFGCAERKKIEKKNGIPSKFVLYKQIDQRMWNGIWCVCEYVILIFLLTHFACNVAIICWFDIQKSYHISRSFHIIFGRFCFVVVASLCGPLFTCNPIWCDCIYGINDNEQMNKKKKKKQTLLNNDASDWTMRAKQTRKEHVFCEIKWRTTQKLHTNTQNKLQTVWWR